MIVRLHVWGARACFIRPEFKVERVSYDVMTPMAARGILEAIHWKPAFRWRVERIHVLNPIEFESLYVRPRDHEEVERRRAAIILKNVSYIIEAQLALTEKAGPDDNVPRHYKMFRRKAARGEAFQPPSLGIPEFPASFSFIDDEMSVPCSDLAGPNRSLDLGWMLHDIDYEQGRVARFFRAKMTDGVIVVPSADSPDLAA